MALAYTRALLKISGEALGGEKGSGLDFHVVEAFAEEQVIAEGKPEAVRAKIVEGKVKKFIAERTLLEQPYVRDDKKTVGDLVKEVSGTLGEAVTVRRFARFQVGAA